MNQNYALLFWLNRSKARNGKAPIYCRITIDGKRTEISMRQSVDPVKWITQAGQAKPHTTELRMLNNYLEMVKSKVYKHFMELNAKDMFITGEMLKNLLFSVDEKQHSIISIFDYHNQKMKERIGIDVVPSTYIKFNTVLGKLKLYLKAQHNRSDMYLTELNHRFVVDFEHYLRVKHHIAHNTTMKYITMLKKVINMAVNNDWMEKNPFAAFKCTKLNVHREILDEAEIIRLHEKEFDHERLEEVRDIFLFCCYTGYAFADVEKLKRTDLAIGIDGDTWIFAKRKKTNTVSNVPLLPQAEEIIQKYSNHPHCVRTGVLLPVKSNQKMNAYLKEIATLCGIKKELTMHIARHTFATTVTLSNGVPIETVSKMLGHTKLATTQIYAKVLEHKVSEDMQKLKEKFSIKIQRKDVI
jgi:site-specific recombinase XerD